MSQQPSRTFELAAQNRIQENEAFAREFFAEILDFDYDECLVTDESCVTDFDITEDEADLRIRGRYGVDVSDVLHTAIVDVLAAIEKRQPRLINHPSR